MQPEPHHWNRDFDWKPGRQNPSYLTEEQTRAFDEQGFILVEDAFSRERMEEVVAEIDPWEERVTHFLRGQKDESLFIATADEITFSTHLVTRSPRLREFCSDVVFQELTADLIGPEVRLYWDQAVYKKPQPGRSFPWHQDNGYTFVEPQQYLTCWVALTDTDERNGCPWVVPGIHRQGTLRHWTTDLGFRCLEDPEGAVPVPARAGSIVVFSSLTPHATGPNETESIRKSYIVQFAPDGAQVLKESPAGGEPIRETQNAPERQFAIVRDGRSVD